MTSMKVIFHLGDIIQLMCWLHACHTLFGANLQPPLNINWSVKSSLLLKVIGVTGMYLALLALLSKPEYIKG